MYNVYMIIFMNILILLFAILVFIAGYFIIDQIINSNFFSKNIYLNKFSGIAEGSFYSLVSIIFQYWLEKQHQEFVPYLFIVSGIVVTFFRGAKIGAASTIGIGLFTLFFFKNLTTKTEFNFYYILVITFASMAMVSILTNFIHPNKALLSLVTFDAMNIIIFWTLSSALSNGGLTEKLLVNSALPFFLSVIIIGVILFLNSFFETANMLDQHSRFDQGSFHRESFQESTIREYINRKNVKTGFYILFDINIDSKDTKILKLTITKILKELELSFTASCVLFKADKTHYGVFVKTDGELNINLMIKNNRTQSRIGNDKLIKIENIIKKLNREYVISSEESVFVNLQAAVVIYGIQESAVSFLQEKALFTLEKINKGINWNKIVLFNPFKKIQSNSEAKDIDLLKKNVDISYISHEFYPVFNIKTKTTYCNVANAVISEGGVISLAASYKYARDIGKEEILRKYIAAKSLTSSVGWNENKIIIKYSPLLINTLKFSEEDFISSILRFNQNPRNIIIHLNAVSLNTIKDRTIIQKNLNFLKTFGITFALNKCNSLKLLKNTDWIEPVAILIPTKDLEIEELQEMQLYCQEKNIEAVANKIDTEIELKKVLKSNISKIGGTLFNSMELYPLNFKKKDTIYIEEILKGEKI